MDASPDFAVLSDAELEASLTRLTARINAATFEQLMLIAEFDRRALHEKFDQPIEPCA